MTFRPVAPWSGGRAAGFSMERDARGAEVSRRHRRGPDTQGLLIYALTRSDCSRRIAWLAGSRVRRRPRIRKPTMSKTLAHAIVAIAACGLAAAAFAQQPAAPPPGPPPLAYRLSPGPAARRVQSHSGCDRHAGADGLLVMADVHRAQLAGQRHPERCARRQPGRRRTERRRVLSERHAQLADRVGDLQGRQRHLPAERAGAAAVQRPRPCTCCSTTPSRSHRARSTTRPGSTSITKCA